jgi:hypothetical protein
VSPASLDTLEARARSVGRALQARRGIKLEQRFRDATGVEHELRSCPVRGGRYLYDASEAWGLRALGLCGSEESRHLEALCDDYARRCSGEQAPLCRPLALSDVVRRSGAADRKGGS